ncbi:N-acetyl-glucosamine-6-phosphate deacetylase [Orbilia ellipsospora]|uniref:Beta-hexosaminidase n=1 Tax=Orbilia ellipsospora TaxID=2528407 RepID=A0AAV9XRB6_9PEZI
MVLLKFLLLATAAVAPVAAKGVWPLPKEQNLGSDVAWLSSKVKFDVKYGPAGNDSTTYQYSRSIDGVHITRRKTSKKGLAEARIDGAVARTKDLLFKDNFVPWMFYKKGVQFTPNLDKRNAVWINKISVTQTDPEPDNTKDVPMDESYTLTIKATGSKEAKVEIFGKTSTGVLHGLTSLTQLFYSDGNNNVYMPSLPVDIKDAPKFGHRGINLDVSRSFYPVDSIKRTIDILSWHKMNRFHIHVTDSQSWPLEIRSMPDLAKKGAYNKDSIYSVQDISDIYSYANLRGIKIVMEIDMPGHTASIAYSRPELIANFNRQPWNGFCAQPPCGQLKLDSPAVDQFVTDLYNDLFARLKQSGATYFHAGGDEYNVNSAAADETVGSNDTAVITPKLQRFVTKLHDQIFAAGFTPFAWEEMVLDFPLKLDKRVIIQSWLSNDSVKKIVEKGYRVIFGNYLNWYLDCGFGQWLDFGGPSFKSQFPTFADYCSPQKNWKAVYYYDPLDGVPAQNQHLVLGGEAHMWSEQVDAEIVDTRIWPRGSAAAEVLWSYNRDSKGEYRAMVDITPRLAEMRERMVARGIKASLVTQGWCLQNPGDCQLN